MPKPPAPVSFPVKEEEEDEGSQSLPALRASFEDSLRKFQSLRRDQSLSSSDEGDFEDEAGDILQALDDLALALRARGAEGEALFLQHDLQNLSFDISAALAEVRQSARREAVAVEEVEGPFGGGALLAPSPIVQFPLTPSGDPAAGPADPMEQWRVAAGQGERLHIAEVRESEEADDLIKFGEEEEEDSTIHSFADCAASNIDGGEDDSTEGKRDSDSFVIVGHQQQGQDSPDDDCFVVVADADREPRLFVTEREESPRPPHVIDIENLRADPSLGVRPVSPPLASEGGEPRLPFSSYEALYDSAQVEKVAAAPSQAPSELGGGAARHKGTFDDGRSSYEDIYKGGPQGADAELQLMQLQLQQQQQQPQSRSVLPEVRWSAPVEAFVGPMPEEGEERNKDEKSGETAEDQIHQGGGQPRCVPHRSERAVEVTQKCKSPGFSPC